MSCDGYEKNQKHHISVGPWGGQEGARWDDGVYCSVRQVVINHGSAIDSIQFKYDETGCPIWLDRHGGTDGYRADKIKLDFPQEFLMSISGYYGCLTHLGPIIVRSLSFESNLKKYGPFGVQEGTQFSSPVTCCMIVGFHGRCSSHLDSIGVYLKPLQQHINPPKVLTRPHHIVAEKFGHTSTVSQETVVLGVREKDEHVHHMVLPNTHLQQQTTHKVVVPFYTEKEYTSDVGWPVKCGPWGGDGGMTFDDGVFSGVREVHIMSNSSVVSIKVCYDQNGKAIWGDRNGGKAALRLDKIVIDYPSEILTHISGHYGCSNFMGPSLVRSLTFHTTKRKYGPFGDEQGVSFSSDSKQGMIVGFHGRKGWLVDSIGVHVLEGNFHIPRSPTIDAVNVDDPKPELCYEMVKGTNPGGVGPCEEVSKPWGGEGGKPWDDGAFSGVKQIYLIKGDAICAIQIEYDRNGQSIWSTRHGGGCGYSTHKIKFEYPYEVLTRINGYYGPIPGDSCTKVIRSLTFFTNRGRFGPFGQEIGTFFSSTTEGKVVGFHGRSGCCLDAIGVHMQHPSGDVGRVKGRQCLTKSFS